jgi:hypothetical protein
MRPVPRALPAIAIASRRIGHEPTMPPTAVILNLTTFGLAVGALLVLMVVVTLLHRHPTRPCHRCGKRVRLDQRVCRHCGYDFEPIRFSS